MARSLERAVEIARADGGAVTPAGIRAAVLEQDANWDGPSQEPDALGSAYPRKQGLTSFWCAQCAAATDPLDPFQMCDGMRKRLGEGLDLAHKLCVGQPLIVALRPEDEATKGPSLFKPAVGNCLDAAIIRNEHPVLLGRMLEMHLVLGHYRSSESAQAWSSANSASISSRLS